MALDRFGPPVYVRRQIVHNTHVVATLEKRGAIFVTEVDEVPPGALVVFSAHGIAPEVRLDAERRGLRAIDATCPLVTKVHNEARRFAAKDYDILLVGHEGHEEVVGTTGRGPGPASAWSTAPTSAADVEVSDPSPGGLAVPDHAVGGRDSRRRSARCGSASRRCSTRRATTSATPPRTARPRSRPSRARPTWSSWSARRTPRTPSAWSRWRQATARAAYLVDDAAEIDERWLDGVTTVGVTSGASVPEELVASVLAKLAELGFGAVEEVEAVHGAHDVRAAARAACLSGDAAPRGQAG